MGKLGFQKMLNLNNICILVVGQETQVEERNKLNEISLPTFKEEVFVCVCEGVFVCLYVRHLIQKWSR